MDEGPLPGKPDLVMSVGERVSMMSDAAIQAGWRPSLRHSSRDKDIVRIEYETRADGFKYPIFVAVAPGVARIQSFRTSVEPLPTGSEQDDGFGNEMENSMNQAGIARFHNEGVRIILVR